LELFEFTRTLDESSHLCDSGTPLCPENLLFHVAVHVLLATINCFLAVLLSAPPLIDGLASADAIQIGQEVVVLLNICGGIFVLMDMDFPYQLYSASGTREGSLGFSDLFAFAGRCYMDGKLTLS